MWSTWTRRSLYPRDIGGKDREDSVLEAFFAPCPTARVCSIVARFRKQCLDNGRAKPPGRPLLCGTVQTSTRQSLWVCSRTAAARGIKYQFAADTANLRRAPCSLHCLPARVCVCACLHVSNMRLFTAQRVRKFLIPIGSARGAALLVLFCACLCLFSGRGAKKLLVPVERQTQRHESAQRPSFSRLLRCCWSGRCPKAPLR